MPPTMQTRKHLGMLQHGQMRFSAKGVNAFLCIPAEGWENLQQLAVWLTVPDDTLRKLLSPPPALPYPGLTQ